MVEPSLRTRVVIIDIVPITTMLMLVVITVHLVLVGSLTPRSSFPMHIALISIPRICIITLITLLILLSLLRII